MLNDEIDIYRYPKAPPSCGWCRRRLKAPGRLCKKCHANKRRPWGAA